MQDPVERFLSSPAFAVAGASTDRAKYGNKVLRCYQQHGRKVHPLNPRGGVIEGLPAVATVQALPDDVKALSIVTPPEVTEQVVDAAIAKGIRHLWMQPGAESPAAVARAEKAGLNVIADGTCLLVVLGYSER